MAKAKKRKAELKAKKLKKKILRRAQNLRPAKRRKVFNVKSKIRKKIKAKKTIRHRKKIVIKHKKKVAVKVRKKVVAKKRAKKPARHNTKALGGEKKQKKSAKKVIKRKEPAKSRRHFGGPASIPAKRDLGGFPAESLFKAKIKVIGVGGGGGSIVSEIGRSLEKATFVIADTDIRALKKKSGIKYFWFGQDLTHGLGTGVNVELAKQAAESAKEKISAIFKDQDIIIFVASLGGGLGSGATKVFADAAREFGGITFGIFTMPFKFEGKNKYRIAQSALKVLRKSLNVSLVIPNEKIFKIIDESTPITAAFSTVNKSLIESLESLIDLIYNQGIINIDFADLRTILKGRGNSAFLNTIEESGKNRVEKICEKVFKNPLLQSSGFIAEKILFNIAGSENLSMFEVEKISSHIASTNPKAKIIFGISKNAKLKNKIKTTILMTGAPPGSQTNEEISVPKIEPVKELVEKVIERKKAKKTKPVSLIPVFEVPVPGQPAGLPVLDQKRADVVQTASALKDYPGKKTIRRSGLEIREAEALEEKKRLAQEKEWEIPAFLRKVKIKS